LSDFQTFDVTTFRLRLLALDYNTRFLRESKMGKGASSLADPQCSRNPHDEAVLVRRAQFEDQPGHPLKEQVRKKLTPPLNLRRRSDHSSGNCCEVRSEHSCSFGKIQGEAY